LMLGHQSSKSQGHAAYSVKNCNNSVVGWPINAGAEIARPDNAAPYCKGGHRETCFSVSVDAHYKFMFAAGVLYELLIGFMFVVLFLSVLYLFLRAAD